MCTCARSDFLSSASYSITHDFRTNTSIVLPRHSPARYATNSGFLWIPYLSCTPHTMAARNSGFIEEKHPLRAAQICNFPEYLYTMSEEAHVHFFWFSEEP